MNFACSRRTFGGSRIQDYIMATRRFSHVQLFKLSLLFALVLILFLLYSPFFLSPDRPQFSNLIQSVNLIISSPYLLLDKIMGIELSWSQTAMIIFFFWFTPTYTLLIVSHNLFHPEEDESG